MIPFDDFLTTKVRHVNREVRSMFSRLGHLNSAVLYGMDGVEGGVPLDLYPFSDPMFLARNGKCLLEAAAFVDMPPAVLLAGILFNGPEVLVWPQLVVARLRALRPDWFLFIAQVRSDNGRRCVCGIGDKAPGDRLLMVGGSNPARSFAIVTPVRQRGTGVEFGETEILDTISSGVALGGDFAAVYAPSGN